MLGIGAEVLERQHGDRRRKTRRAAFAADLPEQPGRPDDAVLVIGDSLQLFNRFTGPSDSFVIADSAAYDTQRSVYQQTLIFGFHGGDFLPGTDFPTGTEFPNLATLRGEFGVLSRVYDAVDGSWIGGGYMLVGEVTSVRARIAQVPEPTAAMLLLAGLVGFGVVRKRTVSIHSGSQ